MAIALAIPRAASGHRPGRVPVAGWLRRPAVAALVAWGVALAVAAPVAGQVMATGDYLARMDGDGDGRVSLAEYQDWMGYAFREMDVNGDSVLASTELPGGKGGPITLEQHRTRLAQRFAKQDANGDGFLDARELAAPPQR